MEIDLMHYLSALFLMLVFVFVGFPITGSIIGSHSYQEALKSGGALWFVVLLACGLVVGVISSIKYLIA